MKEKFVGVCIERKTRRQTEKKRGSRECVAAVADAE